MALRQSFAADVILLAGGTTVGQGLTVLAAPVLTRIYTPEAFGRIGLFMAFIGIASVAASLRYETAIVSARDSKEAAYVAMVSAVLVIPISVISGLALHAIIRLSVLGFGGLPGYTALFIFPSLLMTATPVILRYWCVREHQFAEISQGSLLQNGGRAVSQIGLGFFGLGWIGLLWGDLLGRALGLARMARSAWRAIADQLFPLEYSLLFKVMYVYCKCPIYSFPSALLDALALNLFIPLIAQFYGSNAAGQISLVQGALSLPLILVGAAVADVFHGRIADCARQAPDRAMSLFLRTAAWLLIVGCGPAVLLMLFGQSLFGWVFGERWSMAGLLAATMAPWTLAQLVVSPLSRVIFVYQRHEVKLVYDTMSLLGVAGVIVIGSRQGLSLPQVVAWLSLAQVLVYGLYLLLLVQVVRVRLGVS